MCAVVGFHAPVLVMPQSLQPPCVLEGHFLGLPACQQEYGGFITQTGAHSAGALASICKFQLSGAVLARDATVQGNGFLGLQFQVNLVN